MKKYLLFCTVCAISGGASAGYYESYPQVVQSVPVYQQPQQQVYTYQAQPVPVYQNQQPVYHSRQVIPHSMSSVDQTKAYMSAKIRAINMEADVKVNDFTDMININSISDNTLGGSVDLGVSHKDTFGMLRAEIEYSKNGSAEKKFNDFELYEYEGVEFVGNAVKTILEVESQALMFNGYYHFPTKSAFSPYIGGGIGSARIKASYKSPKEGESGSIKKTNFAWQAGVGVSYDITNNFAIDTGYRYMDYGDFEKDGAKLDMVTHEFYTGVRVSF